MTHCTQLLGILPMSAKSGALGRAIIWLDGRADVQARRMMRKFLGARVFTSIVGAPMCGKDCIPKLLWLKDEDPDRYRTMDCFLDVNGYLIYRSTGNMVMEWSAASAVGMDLKTKQWMKGIARYVGLDTAKLRPWCGPPTRSGS